MKSIISALTLSCLLMFSSCKNSSTATGNAKSEQKAVVYTCPMHPDVKSDKPGKCPKCGMDLVKQK